MHTQQVVYLLENVNTRPSSSILSSNYIRLQGCFKTWPRIDFVSNDYLTIIFKSGFTWKYIKINFFILKKNYFSHYNIKLI